MATHTPVVIYPKKTVRVLREDCMPPVFRVRVWHRLDPGPQQLIPQQGSIGHSIWRGGSESGDEMLVLEVQIWTLKDCYNTFT